MMSVKLHRTDTIISHHVQQANTFGKRLQGLMFLSQLPQGQSMLITPCKSVHTFFMRFDIDVFFLSSTHTVVALQKNMRPFRITPPISKAHAVLETNAGTAENLGIKIGDQLEFTT